MHVLSQSLQQRLDPFLMLDAFGAAAPLYLDVHLPAGSQFPQLLPITHNVFVYAYRGKVVVSGKKS